MKFLNTIIPAFAVFFLSLSAVAQSSTVYSNIREHYDHGFVASGSSPGWYNLNYGTITKTDINGNVLWRRFVGNSSSLTSFSTIWPALDGGFVVSGSVNNHPLLVKFNACGEIDWSKRIQIQGDGNISGILQFGDGSYVAMYIDDVDLYTGTGRTILMNINSYGGITGFDTLTSNIASINNILGIDLILCSDNHLLVPAYPSGIGGFPFLIKTDRYANPDWSTYYSGAGEASINGTDISGEGEIYSIGYQLGAPMSSHAIVYKHKDGNQFWYKPMLADSMTAPWLVCVNNERSYIGAFEAYSDQAGKYLDYLAVYDSAGYLLTRQHDFHEIRKMIRTSDQKFMALGNFSTDTFPDKIMGKYRLNLLQDTIMEDSLNLSPHTYDNRCPGTILTDTLPLFPEIITGIPDIMGKQSSVGSIEVYPNPAGDKVTINFNEPMNETSELIFYNSSGSCIIRQTINTGQPKVEIDISGLQAGLYLIRCNSRKTSPGLVKLLKE